MSIADVRIDNEDELLASVVVSGTLALVMAEYVSLADRSELRQTLFAFALLEVWEDVVNESTTSPAPPMVMTYDMKHTLDCIVHEVELLRHKLEAAEELRGES